MNNILTVTQLNYSARHLLETQLGQIWLMGEISNFSQPISGHWYLTLKDENAQVRCAMFKMKNMRVTFRPQNGMQVLVRASVSLYEPRGDYQLIIESMQSAGDGLLKQQFEQLKMKLAAQGLFAQERKRTIPAFVKRVGIVTSLSGAALQDILNILKRRDPTLAIIIYPTLVQGKEATQDIVQTIELVNSRKECDVLIVGRGGGSLEDLWCFNEEAVAYAIYHSEIPIISAVGHETDVTIADFVADLRAPTPSAAAELISRDQQELIRQLEHYFGMVNLAFDRVWNEKIAHFQQLSLRLDVQHPMKSLKLFSMQFEQFRYRIEKSMLNLFSLQENRLEQMMLRLQHNHPKRRVELQKMALSQWESRLLQQFKLVFSQKKQQWERLLKRVENIPLPHHLKQQQQYIKQLSQQLNYAMDKRYSIQQQHFQALCTKLDGLSPLKILGRGYSITLSEQGHTLTNTKQIVIGDKLVTQLAVGQIISEVVELR